MTTRPRRRNLFGLFESKPKRRPRRGLIRRAISAAQTSRAAAERRRKQAEARAERARRQAERDRERRIARAYRALEQLERQKQRALQRLQDAEWRRQNARVRSEARELDARIRAATRAARQRTTRADDFEENVRRLERGELRGAELAAFMRTVNLKARAG